MQSNNLFSIAIQNPVLEKLNLKISPSLVNSYDDIGNFVLTDTEGKTVWQTNTKLKEELLFELPDLSKGIYLMHISVGQMLFHLKVIL